MNKVITYAERAKRYEAAGYTLHWNKDSWGRSYSLTVSHDVQNWRETVMTWDAGFNKIEYHAHRNYIKLGE